MEGSMKKKMVLFAMTAFMAVMGVRAADYTVGGSQGWTLGVSYSSFTAGKTFKVGDTLEFKYAPSAHNVLEVSKSSYDGCVITNPIKTYATGSDKITLSAAGPRYFICGIPGHCSGGMKVSVNVMAASPSSNSTKSPSPSPAKSPAPSTTPAKSPSPAKSPPKSSSPSVAPSTSPSVAPSTSPSESPAATSPSVAPSTSPSESPVASGPPTPSSSAPGPSGTNTTPSSATAPGGAEASPPNNDNSAAASSLSPAILSFLGAVALFVF